MTEPLTRRGDTRKLLQPLQESLCSKGRLHHYYHRNMSCDENHHVNFALLSDFCCCYDIINDVDQIVKRPSSQNKSFNNKNDFE